MRTNSYKRALAAVGIAAVIGIFGAGVAPALAANPAQGNCVSGGSVTGTLNGVLYSDHATSNEKTFGAGSECGTVYVRVRYSVVGGTDLWSGWTSGTSFATSVNYAKANRGEHKATRVSVFSSFN